MKIAPLRLHSDDFRVDLKANWRFELAELAEQMATAVEWLKTAKDIVVFTGAGISAESGIPTFRDQNGLWSKFPPDRFATLGGLGGVLMTDPGLLADFILAVLEPIVAARPNPGHKALADLQQVAAVTVITQNIDGLHQEAGSKRVYEVHGSLFEIVDGHGRSVGRLSKEEVQHIVEAVRVTRSNKSVRTALLTALKPAIHFGIGGIRRPKVVLFGEAMAEPDWSLALEAIRHCDCMLMVGTSATVYPAAALPREARLKGARLIAVDPKPCDADTWLRGTAATILPDLVSRVMT